MKRVKNKEIDGTEYKYCGTCDKWLELVKFNYKHSNCKECKSRYDKEYRKLSCAIEKRKLRDEQKLNDPDWLEYKRGYDKEYRSREGIQERHRSLWLPKYKKKRKVKRKNDEVFILKERISRRLRIIFTTKTEHLNIVNCYLGCTCNYLRSHLIDSFERNYNMPFDDSYIKYLDIDHITPLSEAETIEDTICLNHYSNLQILYHYHNVEKMRRDSYIIPPFPVDELKTR